MARSRDGVLSIRSDGERSLRRAVAAVAILALLGGTSPARAAPPVADPGASKRPTIDLAPNGKPIVQITDPSAGGVSRNRYVQFDVDAGGLILNNSASLSKTQLAGYIPGNPNLSRSAAVILNEVTGTVPSQLGGYLEVAGPRAEVVVANPNGITCTGCGFINVSRSTLTTGTPVFGGAGSLDGFRVLGGGISIEGAGLHAGAVDQVDLLSRTLRLNAGVWARRIEVVTGANQIWRDDLQAVPLTPAGAGPEVSLDVGALGGMYAGKIRLIGTERGVGVVSAGKLASTGDFTLRADGRIVLGGETTAAGTMDVAGGGDVEVSGVLHGDAALQLQALGQVSSTGLISSRDTVQVSAARIVTTGTIAAGVTRAQELTSPGALTLRATGAIDAGGGTLLAGGDLNATGDSLALGGATVQALGDLSVAAAGGDVIATDARMEAGGALRIEAQGAVSARGASLLGGAIGIGAETVDLTRGASATSLRSVGDLNLTAGAHLLAADATLHTQGSLTATALSGTLDATGADVSAETATLVGSTLLLDRARAQASGDLRLSAVGLLGAYQSVLRARAIDAQTGGQLDAAASTIEGSTLRLEGGSLSLAGASAQSAGELTLLATAGGIDTSRGRVAAGGGLLASATGTFLNDHGQVDGHGVRIVADAIDSRGTGAHIASQGRLELYGTSAIRNEGGSLLYASGDLWLGALDAHGEYGPTLQLVTDTDSTIEAGGSAVVQGVATLLPVAHPVTAPPITGVTVVPTDPPSATPELQFTLPGGGIFHVNPDAGRPLIETDPRFTDLRTFLTSDYMLSRLPSTPESTLKRLGDGFYEEQLVLDQVALLTGRKFLNEYTDAQAQYQALMDQGLQAAKAMQLSVGVKLTDAQVAMLTAPMVWLVKANVDGHDVLVPRVYVPSAQAVALGKRGAIVAGTDLVLGTKDDVALSQNLRAGQSVSVSARSITAGEAGYSTAKDLQLVAEKDIDLTATQLAAGGDLTLLSRGGDVNVGARTRETTRTDVHGNTTRDVTVTGTTLTAGGDVTIAAKGEDGGAGSVRLTGATVRSSGGSVTLLADRDVELGAAQALHEERDREGKLTGGTVTHGLTSVDAAGGSVQLAAGSDARLEGATLSAGKDVLVQAERNVSHTAVNDSVTQERGTYGKKYERTYDEAAQGSVLVAGGSVAVVATGAAPAGEAGTGKVTMQGASLAANGGAITVVGQDVHLGVAREEHDSLRTDVRHKSGFLSSKTTSTRDEVRQDLAVGSQLSAAAVAVTSEGDLTLEGAQIAGGGDVVIQAGKELRILAAQDHITEQHDRRVTRSGVLGLSGGGVGIMIGSRTETTKTNIDTVAHQASNVGSVEGGLTVDTPGSVTILGSNLVGKESIDVSGSNATIGAVQDTQTVNNVVTVVQDGLSLSLGNAGLDAARAARDAGKRAVEVKDDRLQALYAFRAAREADAARKLLGTKEGRQGVAVTLGLSHSESRTETVTETRTAVGSSLTSDGDITVVARGDPGQGQGDLTVTGSSIQGANVTLDAARDLRVESAENGMEQSTDSSSWTATVGVSARGGKGGAAVGVHASGSVSDSDQDAHDRMHTESVIEASGALTLRSGRDTTLKGGVARGGSIAVDVGRDLTIESEQDVSTYHSADRSLSGQVTYGGGASASVTASAAGMESSYRSVQQQSGLFAGEGGYQVRVGGRTDLRGGVIASEADPAKNLLDTGSLTYSDIQNESKYSAVSASLTVGIGGGGVTPGAGVPVQGDRRSTTFAAVGEGAIVVRDGSQDLTGLSRDTTSATNAIGNIFDRAKLEEQKELVEVFGQEAYKAVGDLAKHYTRPYEQARDRLDAAERYRELLAKGEGLDEREQQELDAYEAAKFTPENVDAVADEARAAMEKYQSQYDTWKDGSPLKTALHAAVGAAQAGLGGGSILAGGVGAGASERLSEVTSKLPPSVKPFASMVIGAAAAKLTGAGTLGTIAGGATADYGAKFNRQLHEDEKVVLRDLAKRYVALGFKSEQEAYEYLVAVGCSLTRCGEEIPEKEEYAQERAGWLAISALGAQDPEAQKMLQRVALAIADAQAESNRTRQRNWAYGEQGVPGLPYARVPHLFEAQPAVDADIKYSITTRIGGGVQTLAGVGGVALSIPVYATCETVVGCFAAYGLTVYSGDMAATGFSTLIDGTSHNTNFVQSMLDAGLSPQTAHTVDFFVGTTLTLGVASLSKAPLVLRSGEPGGAITANTVTDVMSDLSVSATRWLSAEGRLAARSTSYWTSDELVGEVLAQARTKAWAEAEQVAPDGVPGASAVQPSQGGVAGVAATGGVPSAAGVAAVDDSRYLVSRGANVVRSDGVVATARDPRAFGTSIYPSIGEQQAYLASLEKGEVGLQGPGSVNATGNDFVTARINQSTGHWEIWITDVETSQGGSFSKAAPPAIKQPWVDEALDATAAGRLSIPGRPDLDVAIRDAALNGRIRLRFAFVDYSPEGQGAITFAETVAKPPVPVPSAPVTAPVAIPAGKVGP
jgi:filamentous hemagglutinin